MTDNLLQLRTKQFDQNYNLLCVFNMTRKTKCNRRARGRKRTEFKWRLESWSKLHVTAQEC